MFGINQLFNSTNLINDLNQILARQKTLTPVEALTKAGLTDAPIVSYKISRLGDNKNDGEITFGFEDFIAIVYQCIYPSITVVLILRSLTQKPSSLFPTSTQEDSGRPILMQLRLTDNPSTSRPGLPFSTQVNDIQVLTTTRFLSSLIVV